MLLVAVTAITAANVPDFGSDFVPSTLDNMNGEYPISTTPGGTKGKFPKKYRDYPGGAQAFDVYSPPMTTLYSQVWWKDLDPAPLPDEIIKRYNGSKMAIIGWEIDQVRRTPAGDVSVPISACYNHHYVSQMIGSAARFKQVHLSGPDDPRAIELMRQSGHGMIAYDQPHWIVEEVQPSGGASKTHHQQFSSANGGEYRKTYHGFAPGYALVIDSPTAMQISPMQIDTWNRDKMDISGPLPPPFVPGPLPRASLAPKHGALHSGLLECPMTTRLTKAVVGTYAALDSATCDAPLLTYQECFHAAAVSLANRTSSFVNTSGSDASKPPGCSADVAGGTSHVFFNDMSSSTAACTPEAMCICPVDPKPFGQARGALHYHPTNQSVDVGTGAADYFGGASKMCKDWPSTDLLTHKNPTCDLRTYRGGQWACHHKWSLLDADQPIPWADQPLVFHHKYRFWVQPYRADYHTPLTLGETVGSALLLGSPWEYDVPKCADGVGGCSRAADGTWIHTVVGNTMGKHTFVALNNHCHAPTCLSVQVFACHKGTPLEQCTATNGKLVCRTDPVYGGTGAPSIHGGRFDEAGYIAIPDCFWGDDQWGLEPPLDVDGVPLHIVKIANATDGHYGEMSGGQPWVYS